MKFLIAALALSAGAQAHAIFQQLSVNGKTSGQLVALRAPSNNNPVQDVTSQSIICGQPGTTSQTIVDIAPGDQFGAYWQHVIGGAQFSGDPDNPIASSHKGPITAYLAKVDNAASASLQGLKWFKIAEDGFDPSTKQWGVDHMISNNGWAYFSIPTCIAPGEYLLRVEILALHSAHVVGEAQFYQSCAQVRIGGSGTFSPSASDLVSFPGAYKADDPGIHINIYGTTGQPDLGGKPYTIPGPSVIKC